MIGVREWEAQAGIRRAGSRRPSPPTNLQSAGTPSQGQTSSDTRVQAQNEVRELVSFCVEEFLPFIFPALGSRDLGNDKRQRNIRDSKSNRPATFWSLLSVAAAHRSITTNPDLDLDPLMHNSDDSGLASTFSSMNLMKHYALKSIEQTIQQAISSNQSCDEHIVEAVFLLIGAALAVGNLQEARLHFLAMASSMRQDPSFDHRPISGSPWIPVYDLAYAGAMMVRPLFDLPWDEDNVHDYLRDKVPSLQSSNKLARMGYGFGEAFPNASAELRTIVSQARQIALIRELVTDLSHAEHEQLYRKILQVQHDILMYLCMEDESSSKVRLIEKVVCHAILALISITMVRVLPPTGQGRQMTYHHNEAVEKYLETSGKTQPEMKALLWAVLLFRQFSVDDEKSEYFDRLLQRIVREVLKLRSGAEAEGILYQFLYIPRTQEQMPMQVLEAALKS